MRVETISRQVQAGTGLFAAVFFLSSLAACGTISREYANTPRWPNAVLALPEGVRIPARQAPQALALAERTEVFPPIPRHAILALSGGGANGAYGAGVLVGWSRNGSRPRFDVVTGVSTGALAAPFAFLGSDWDDALEHVYAGGGARRLLGWTNFAALAAPSLFSSGTLRRLIDENITLEMLRQIAREHAQGRRLLVVTTNLDAEQSVIWDMGAVAAGGDDKALVLFRNVLLASASMPGIFPPVLLQGVSPEGASVAEMHADGGVNLPFLGVPEALPAESIGAANPPRRVLYILVNGQVTASYQVTRGNLRGILARSLDSWGKASLRAALAENAAYANRNGMDVFIAAIPDGIDASILNFAPEAMRSLFQLGSNSAATELVWARVSSPRPQAPDPPKVAEGSTQVPID